MSCAIPCAVALRVLCCAAALLRCPRLQTPRELVKELNRFIVGQGEAKKAVAVALRPLHSPQQPPDTPPAQRSSALDPPSISPSAAVVGAAAGVVRCCASVLRRCRRCQATAGAGTG